MSPAGGLLGRWRRIHQEEHSLQRLFQDGTLRQGERLLKTTKCLLFDGTGAHDLFRFLRQIVGVSPCFEIAISNEKGFGCITAHLGIPLQRRTCGVKVTRTRIPGVMGVATGGAPPPDPPASFHLQIGCPIVETSRGLCHVMFDIFDGECQVSMRNRRELFHQSGIDQMSLVLSRPMKIVSVLV